MKISRQVTAVLKNIWAVIVSVFSKPLAVTVVIIISFLLFFYASNKYGFSRITSTIRHDFIYADSTRDSIVTAHANYNSCTKALANQYQYFKRYKHQHITIATEYEIYYYCFVLILIITTVITTIFVVLIARKGWENQTPVRKAAFFGFFFCASITGIFMNVFNNEGNVGNNMSKYFYFTNLQTNIYNAMAIDSALNQRCADSTLIKIFIANNNNLKDNMNLFLDIKADKIPVTPDLKSTVK